MSIHSRGGVPAADAEDESVVVLRDFGEDALQFVGQHFEPGALGVAQFDHHVGALRLGGAHAPDGGLQTSAHSRLRP